MYIVVHIHAHAHAQIIKCSLSNLVKTIKKYIYMHTHTNIHTRFFIKQTIVFILIPKLFVFLNHLTLDHLDAHHFTQFSRTILCYLFAVCVSVSFTL